MKKDVNGGFSLVELIVVVAIMAVLVGVLAPAYLKYVEKSRKSSDIQALDQALDAALAVATDEEYYIPIGTEFHIDINNGAVYFSIPVWSATANGVVRDDRDWERAENEWLETTNEGDPYDMKSKEWSTGEGSAVGLVGDGGMLYWSVSESDEVFTSMMSYSADFASSFSTTAGEEENEEE